METDTKVEVRECLRCQGELPEGVRYCVACGTLNMDTDADKAGAAKIQMASDRRMACWKAFAYWCRWFNGIRR